MERYLKKPSWRRAWQKWRKVEERLLILSAMNVFFGFHVQVLNAVNGCISPDKTANKTIGIQELKTPIEKLQMLITTRLSELWEAQEDTLILSYKLQEVELSYRTN
ncbi:hypothetical protein AQUCO_00900358v1 [Aquilegia coerulea]|uniref:Uncharacterized protein n=1 Tax=Aquilegia coerulea TaxID=218851 RepID=A0A2G5ED74_AQUCA|nr:hypothetical protein AQUCO_00900358v1 [Aquilegia coerulea]